MSSRPLEIVAFLDRHQWGAARAQALEGDFSTRRYARLTKESGETAFLMDADADQKTPEFLAVAKSLRQTGVHAPEIYAAEAERGLILMQDFGMRNVGALLDAGESPRPYYLRAAEVLARLHLGLGGAVPLDLELPFYNAAVFTTQVELFLDAYFPFAAQREASDEERQEFRMAWQTVLRPIDDTPKSLLLRDFMPDNLMDLPTGGLGVLDFQDAGIGPIAYDLASLCEEVRRDGGFALLPDVVSYYREMVESPISQADLVRACTVLSAQRHMRVLGIVARLAVKMGRRDKLGFVPRIRQHLAHILKEPYLSPIKAWVKEFGGTIL